MCVYEPALLMIGSWPSIIQAFITSSIGIALVAAGLHGYLLTRASMWQRAVLVVAGLLLVDPGLITDIIGFLLAALVIAVQWFERKNAPAVQPKAVKQSL
jgi:TRAP-type uncharacterized transport system fused permease subunit